jgi:hypothetical protein
MATRDTALMDKHQDEQAEPRRHSPSRLGWLTLLFILLMLILGKVSDQSREDADRRVRPLYYAHIEQFGDPITVNEATSCLNGMGYQDLDLSHIKGPLMIPEGWLLGLIFKSARNPNDQLFWFVKSGKHGIQDITMYPGNRYPIPAYP